MSALNIKKLSAKLQAVAAKKSLESKDLTLLREVKEGISQALQTLKECDSCGAAVLEIARLELDGVRAAVCPACGIKALKNRSLVVNRVKKKAAIKKATAPKKKAAAPRPKPKAQKKEIKRREIKEPARRRTRISLPAVKAVKKDNSQTALDLGAAPPPRDKNEAFAVIAEETGARIGVVKKIYAIASSVAFPMNLERTINYTKMEAQSQGIVVDVAVLKKMMTLLVQHANLKVRN